MLVIIQARTDSKRFPKKVLFNFKNNPIIFHVINRLKKSVYNNAIVVSTSINKSDDFLVKLLKKRNIKVYRGSLNNVAERLFKTAKYYKKKYFVRVSCDSPLIDAKILDKMILIFKNKKYYNYDIITNVYPKTFPKGMSFEIIKNKIIYDNLNYMNKNEKEHVTKYFYKNYKKFKIKNLLNFNKKKYSKNLSLDKPSDLKIINKLWDSYYV